jgi:hypothetical protein
MRKPRCRICNKELEKEEAYCISRLYLSKTGKDAGKFKTEKKYYCSEEEYENNEHEKMKEKCIFNEICNFIKTEILHYDKQQSLPLYFIQRIYDLRNGTVVLPKIGRVKQSKEGYSYEVILETFKKHLQDINFWVSKKQFKNEQVKINYIMKIIDGNINDIYLKQKQEKKIENEQETITTNIDIDFNLPVQKQRENKKQYLMDILTEEDL